MISWVFPIVVKGSLFFCIIVCFVIARAGYGWIDVGCMLLKNVTIVSGIELAIATVLQYMCSKLCPSPPTHHTCPLLQPVGYIVMATWLIYLLSLLATTVSCLQ